MERHYKHLNAEERGVIFAEHRWGSSLRQIGRLLGRHHGAIGLELKRGTAPCGYDLEERIPARHLLRKIRQVVNDALANLDAEFEALYAGSLASGLMILSG